MKMFKAAAALCVGLLFAGSVQAEKLSISIKQPKPGSFFFVNQPIEISGTAQPAAKISAVTVRVAGQTLRPIGTNRWSVGVTISQPGRYTIVAIARADRKHRVTRKRTIDVVYPIR